MAGVAILARPSAPETADGSVDDEISALQDLAKTSGSNERYELTRKNIGINERRMPIDRRLS